jgi:sugar-specific transcriptional regulator TrmB/ABC-type transporter Mla subunit MlaD
MLQEIGLSENEGKVYAALATNYFRTLEEAHAYSEGLSREDVSSALESLEGKKFVRKISGKVDLYIAINPHLTVTSEAEKRLEADLNTMSDSIREIWERTSKELRKEITEHVGSVREKTSKYTNELNSQTVSVLAESEEGIRSTEQDVHKELTNFMTESENMLGKRLENTVGQFEKEGEGFLELMEEQTNTMKENLSNLEAEMSTISSESIRNKPTEAIVAYREEVQNQAISRIQESIDQFSVLQDQLRDLFTTISGLVEQGKAGVEQAIQTQGERAVEKFSENIDQLDQTLAEIEEKTTKLSAEFVSDLKKSLEPLRENLKAMTSSETSIKETFGNMENSLQDSTATLLTELETTLQTSKDQLVGVKESSIESLETRFSQMDEEYSARTDETLTSMMTVREYLNQGLENLQKQIGEVVENIGISASQGLDESISSVSGRIGHLQGLIRENFESLESGAEMVFGQMQGSLGTTATTAFQQIAEKTKKSTESLVSDEIPQEKEAFKARLEEACSSAEKIAKENARIQQMFKETYQSETELKRTTLNKTVVSRIDGIRDDLVSSLEKLNVNITDANDRMREKVPQDVELMVEDQRNRVMHINMDVRAALRELLNPITDLIREGPEATKKQLKKKEIFQEFYETLKRGADNAPAIEDKIENALTQNVEEFSTAVNDYLDFFSKTVQDSGQKTQQFIEDAVVKTQDETNALKATIYSELGSFIDAAGNIIDENIANASDETEKIVKAAVDNLSSLSASLVETTDRISSKLTDLSDFINKIADQSRESTNTQMGEFATTIKGTIRAILDQSVEQINSTIQDFAGKVESSGQSQKDKMSEEVKNTVEEIGKTFLDAIDSSNEAFEKTKGLVTKLQEQTSESLKLTQNDISTSLESILVAQEEGDIESAFKTLLKLHSEIEKRLESLRTGLSKMLVEQRKELLNVQTAALSEIDREFDRFEEKLTETANRQVQVSKEFESMKSLLTEKREKSIGNLEDSIRSSQESQKAEMSLQINAILKDQTPMFDNVQNILSDEASKLTKLRADLHKDIETVTDNYKRELERLSEDLSAKSKQLSMSFASQFDGTFLNLKGNTDSFISENKKGLQEELAETTAKLRTLIENLEKQALVPIKASEDQFSSLMKNASERIATDLDSHVTNLDTKSTALVKELSEKIGQDIDSIPETMRRGLEKTGSVMKFIRAVHDLAISTPPNPIESTYFVTGKEEMIGALKGALGRTKTAINIITPVVSYVPLDLIKTLPKTRRIQVLTGIDDQSVAKELIELGNVQLREYPGEEGTIGFFRDGEEEGGIGASSGDGGEMIITVDSSLVKTFQQLFADLWPRGKKL